MISTFICFHCGREVPRNPRIKHQKYCGARQCQQARIRSWKNKQYKTNRKYKSKSLAGQKAWRSKYPAYKYQREYRAAHPEYVARNNRDLQRERNKKRQKDPSTMIVNTDSLLFQPMKNGVYTLSRIKKNMIVNRNALSLQPSRDGVYALLKVKEKKIVNRNALVVEVHT